LRAHSNLSEHGWLPAEYALNAGGPLGTNRVAGNDAEVTLHVPATPGKAFYRLDVRLEE